jgi:phosphatidylserine/phosphatidylglycerophosphate/cardiolipin synthase-like enzyme
LTIVAQQIKAGAKVELFTTPPAGKDDEFRRKYLILEALFLQGPEITLNSKLHAKAFCFSNQELNLVTILGSANLTSGGLVRNLELAVFSARPGMYHSVLANIRLFQRDKDTTNYVSWRQQNSARIASARAVKA